MDPQSVLDNLLNRLATSRDLATLRDDASSYDEIDDDEPIDLVYYGRKPLTSSSSGHVKGPTSLGEPIPIMKSRISKEPRFYEDGIILC